MDNAFLTPLAAEVAERLTGVPLGDVIQIDSKRFVLRFSTPPFPRLCVDLHPEVSALHFMRRAPTPRDSTDLAVALSERLSGAVVSGLDKEPLERVVEMRFAGPGEARSTLVIELMGRASNLLLLDEERRILRFLRSHKGEFRSPVEGAPYVPPSPRRDDGPALPYASRLLRREMEALIASGRDEREALDGIESRMSGSAWAPVLYAPVPIEDLDAGRERSAATFFPAPFELASVKDLHARRFDTLDEAAAAWAEITREHLAFRDLRGSLGRHLSSEIERMRRLLGSLGKEREAARGAGEARRRAELILASLATARKEKDHVVLRDFFDPQAPEIRIPVDPRLDLKGNAEALFRRARKLDRAGPVVERRMGEVAARLARAEAFAARLAAARAMVDLETLETALDRSSAIRVVRRPERKESGRKPSFIRIREYKTSDGFTIVAGRSGKDNDVVTFKMAAPHDFWLHAAGRPGAHVIVRNPKRSKDLPDTALREAAALAAWFSRGDRETEVEVHYTKRKEVRKGKGMSPGMVLLRAFKSIKVRPGLPPGAAEE